MSTKNEKLAMRVARELVRLPNPTAAEIMAVADKVSANPASCAELIGMISSCNHVSMIRRMIIWQARHGPCLKD